MTRLLVTGPPGSGKTTLAERVVARLRAEGAAVAGFTTGELRENRRRVGFRVAAIDGPEEVLAHVDLPGPPRVGGYGVDVAAFERVALPALRAPGILVIDELGKMELASAPFRDAIDRLLDRAASLLATVHTFRHPYTDSLLAREDVTTFRLTRANRDRLVDELTDQLLREPGTGRAASTGRREGT